MDVLLRLNRENETTFIMITHNTSLASAMQFQHRMENGQLHLLPND
jgi:predicted ABC-type transport system involved in lysophospholipase L1 biosynthesis ATPase subunit